MGTLIAITSPLASKLAQILSNSVVDMTSSLESRIPHPPKENLRQAFELFNEMSQQLSDSYERLEGQVTRLSGELAEVSAARMKELKEKEQLADRLHSLLELLPGGVVVLDGNGFIQDSNPAAHQMLGNSRLKGRRWLDVINRYFQPREDDGHEVSLKNGRRLSIQTSSLENEPGQIVLMIDQTETRHLQDKLARHQRLTAMGKMVASLAHQVRTPLSGAMLYAEHLSNTKLDEVTQTRFAKKLTRQLKNIEAQVRDMMIFARGSAPLNRLINIQELTALIEESIQILKKQSNVDIDIMVCPELGTIQCHEESLIGAIQNLISNAIEAVSEVREQPKVTVKLEKISNHLHIKIIDNGDGLSDDVIKKLSEPFFTTKSNGTGLGIPVVNAVIRAHHGQLTFENNKDKGACFSLIIPVKNEHHTPDQPDFNKESVHA